MSITQTAAPTRPSSKAQWHGSRFELPAKETTTLKSEAEEGITPGNLLRVLDCFVVFTNGHPSSIDPTRYTEQNWQGVSAVGAAAPLLGKGKYFAQCGWFHQLQWLWIYLPVVQAIVIKKDSRFRNGEPVMWLKTPAGEYAMLAPHRMFIRQWGASIASFGDNARVSTFRRWPPTSLQPPWWPADAADRYPSPNELPSPPKRRASDDTGELDNVTARSNKRSCHSSSPDEPANQENAVSANFGEEKNESAEPAKEDLKFAWSTRGLREPRQLRASRK
ncbi:hypothetical protein FRC07_004944 [Ceratobasidium sp. 392]|nr:hypothetical protein FRC07_004944 [Ceratobasidium sp. 392]